MPEDYTMSLPRPLPILAIVFAATWCSPAYSAGPEGLWLVKDKTGRIRIEKCGDKMWGTIAWQKNPKKDENNPNAALRARALVGSAILVGMRPAGANHWEGDIYNPQNGKTYKSKMTLQPSGNALDIQGCVLGGLICGGESWTRIADNTPGTAAKNNCAAARAGR
jgi:uncharacterized protein (DUF2147 family)